MHASMHACVLIGFLDVFKTLSVISEKKIPPTLMLHYSFFFISSLIRSGKYSAVIVSVHSVLSLGRHVA